MGFRFSRRVRLLPGVTLNFSARGMSITLGFPGFSHTIGPRYDTTTVGLPGTGLSYSKRRRRR